MEAFVQFFLGRYSEDLTYEDDLLVSLQRNLTSVSGFWFDCVTSIPWSYMDLHQYLVRPLLLRRARSFALILNPRCLDYCVADQHAQRGSGSCLIGCL